MKSPTDLEDKYMTTPVTIKFKPISPEARIPKRATPYAAGFDLTAASVEVLDNTVRVHTGLTVQFPEDYVLLIFGRSGWAFNYQIHLSNGVGVIDSDYRGEIVLSFESSKLDLPDMAKLMRPGSRVAQALLMPIVHATWEEVSELTDTVRGEGGFGSTGVGP